MSRILYIIMFLVWMILYNNFGSLDSKFWTIGYYIVQYLLLIYLCVSGFKSLRTKKQRLTILLLGIPFLVPLWAEIASLWKDLDQYIEYVNGELFNAVFGIVVIVILIITLRKNV